MEYKIEEQYPEGKLMSKRIAICLDKDIEKKLRLKQAKIIQSEQISYSFSRVINETLRKALK